LVFIAETLKEMVEMLNKWVIGNWKMHGNLANNKALIEGIRAELPKLDARVGMVVCPVFPYIPQLKDLTAGSGIGVGAQNLSEQKQGAYTGEVAGAMLKDVGVDFVIVGHSERRTYFGENNELIARKAQAVIDNGLIPVVCIGESLEERQGNQTEAVLTAQLDALFAVIGTDNANIILAYEPRWAIGTGVAATPDMIQAVHTFVRTYLTKRSAAVAGLPILYGGSMNGANAASIATLPNVDGGLIGSAALKPAEFVAIYKALVASVA